MFLKNKYLNNLFILICLVNYSLTGQNAFNLYESTWEQDPMGELIDTFFIQLNQGEDEFIFDTQILLDSININNSTHVYALNQTCIDYSEYPHYYYTFSLDTVCTSGVTWEQVIINDCNTGVCIYYADIVLPLQGSEIGYGFPNFRCNRNSFLLDFQNINVSNSGFIELILKIGTYEELQNGTLNFNNVYYSEYPIIVSINGGSCFSGENVVSIDDITNPFYNNIEISYSNNGSIIEIIIDQSIDLESVKLDLIDVTGQKVSSIPLNHFTTNISNLNLKSGIYFLTMSHLKNGHKISKKILIK